MSALPAYHHPGDGDPSLLGELCSDCGHFAPGLVDWLGDDRLSRPNLLYSNGAAPGIPAIIAALGPALGAVAPAYSELWRRLDAHWRRPGARRGKVWAPVPAVVDALRTLRALLVSLHREILLAIDDAIAEAETAERACAVLDEGLAGLDSNGDLVPAPKAEDPA
ncbi:MAG: hypothetical protein ACP5M5_13665 [Acidibrevibacterium sp.]|uniref:hypothetical protein n=1 Tax=Acidibrevibacterium sp. TaxID=2606776 RepID=UPI003D0185B0